MAETLFPEDMRRKLRTSLVSTGIPEGSAAVNVDLACQGADRAVQAIFTTAKMATGPADELCVIQIAAQLAGFVAQRLADNVTKVGDEMGLCVGSTEITL